MAWPAGGISQANTDQGTDDPSAARVEINTAIGELNDVIASRGAANGIPTLGAGGLIPIAELPVVTIAKGGTGAITAAAARTALDAQQALGFTPADIAGATFSGPVVGTEGGASIFGLTAKGAVGARGRLNLLADKDPGVALDHVGLIRFTGFTSVGSVLENYADIQATIIDPVLATASSRLRFKVLNSAADAENLWIQGDYVDLRTGNAGVNPGNLRVGGTVVIDASRDMFTDNITALTAAGMSLVDFTGGKGLHVADTTGDVTFDAAILMDGTKITGATALDIDASGGVMVLDSNVHIFFDTKGLFRWRDSDDANAERMQLDSNTGVLQLNAGSADGPYFQFAERSADPANPAEGVAVMWMSDGTDTGDDGDVLMMTTAGAVTKKGVVFDASAF